MAAGLSTPLHLAASLLALTAAAGLALATVARRRTPDKTDQPPAGTTALVVAGGASLAVAHLLSGALLDVTGVASGWLRALGLVLIAAGLLLPVSHRLAAPAVLVPAAPVPAAAVAVVAGLVGGARALRAGRSSVLLGLGLAAWGIAEGVAAISSTLWAWLVILGALALGSWVWQTGARRLQAKFVTVFVICLLAVVVLIAGVLSGIGSIELVEEELDRLEGFSELLADEIGNEWPAEALAAARPLSSSGERLLAIDAGSEPELRAIYNLSFRQQDFFLLFGPGGAPLASFGPDPEVISGPFQAQVHASGLIEELIEHHREDGGLISVGGHLVALGGVPLVSASARGEDPPDGALVTGRRVDELWAEHTSDELGVELLVTVDDRIGVGVSELDDAVAEVPAQIADTPRGVISVDGHTRYVATEPILEPNTREQLGEVVVMSSAEALAGLERTQTRRLFLLAVLGAALAGLAVATLTRRLVAPVRRLTEASAAVREGHLDVVAGVDTPDEIGELGRTFDEMTVSLAAQSRQLHDAADVEGRLRARLEALTQSMSDALVAVDLDGSVVTFNIAAERLVGVAADDAIGRPLADTLTGAGPGGRDPATALGAPGAEEVTAVQLVLSGAGGRPVPTAATAAPVRDVDRRVLGRVLVLRDVTRETEVERMKTEFLSNVSHELRTPLTPIRGYAEVLARREVEADARQRFAGQILEATARLERVVALIVDFAALDSGRLQPRHEPTGLDAVIAEALADWRARHPERTFRRRLARDLPPVLVDPGMLRRCIDELVDNAVKFSPEDEPVTITAVGARRGDERAVRLSIRDQGVGLDDDLVSAVFADFYQVDASDTRHHGGLGLGLALVRRLVDALGGSVTVDTGPDQGAAFHLWLPVVEGLAGDDGEVDEGGADPERSPGYASTH